MQSRKDTFLARVDGIIKNVDRPLVRPKSEHEFFQKLIHDLDPAMQACAHELRARGISAETIMTSDSVGLELTDSALQDYEFVLALADDGNGWHIRSGFTNLYGEMKSVSLSEQPFSVDTWDEDTFFKQLDTFIARFLSKY